MSLRNTTVQEDAAILECEGIREKIEILIEVVKRLDGVIDEHKADVTKNEATISDLESERDRLIAENADLKQEIIQLREGAKEAQPCSLRLWALRGRSSAWLGR